MPTTVFWSLIKDNRDKKWAWSGCLYAYVDPDTEAICYIGKADGSASTVWVRYKAPDKERVYDIIEKKRGLFREDLAIIVGEITHTGAGSNRLTRELLADIESLLIWNVSPIGNHRNIFSRTCCRPGMIVECFGDWPHPTNTFYDDGPTYTHIGEVLRNLSH